MSGMAQVAIHGVTSHSKRTFHLNEQNRLHVLSYSESAHQTSSWSCFKLPVPAPSDLCVSYKFLQKGNYCPIIQDVNLNCNRYFLLTPQADTVLYRQNIFLWLRGLH